MAQFPTQPRDVRPLLQLALAHERGQNAIVIQTWLDRDGPILAEHLTQNMLTIVGRYEMAPVQNRGAAFLPEQLSLSDAEKAAQLRAQALDGHA